MACFQKESVSPHATLFTQQLAQHPAPRLSGSLALFPEWENNHFLGFTQITCALLLMSQFQNMLKGQPGVPPPRVSFCQIQQGLNHQPKCGGCKRIEALIQYWSTSQNSRRDGRRPSPQSKPELIHNSYKELDFCSQQCITCRVIRRGLLLNQPMINEASRLGIYPHGVWATMVGAEVDQMTLDVTLKPNINSPRSPFTSSITFDEKGGTTPAEVSLATRADTKAVYDQVKSWADACHRLHSECGNLNWSIRNPTRLLHITSASHVQLVSARQYMGLVRYAALSYCWGSPDDEQIQLGRTTDGNFAYRQSRPFPITDLPATIRDAITMTRGCGLEYIWVDSVCIIQENVDDWFTEANRMHEVYANAYFTICAASVDSASAGLFHTRQAWKYSIEPCELATQRISIRSSSFKELIEGSTWSSRAWTLQEEYLSPRIVYWTPQRMYWSCSRCFMTEGEPPGAPSPPSVPLLSQSSFLVASRSGQDLHERWYDLVESFTKRNLTNPKDKFPAISGIAMRYRRCRPNDEYLAGIWRDTFARDLAWRTPVYLFEVEKSLRDVKIAPSWSWASLPGGHPAIMRRHCESDDEQRSRSLLVEPRSENLEEGTMTDLAIKGVQVEGRMRPLLSGHSQRQDWSDVSVPCVDGQEKFSFKSYVNGDTHCIDLSRGLVLAYEAHREETLGHIDYLVEADRMYRGVSDVQCLEIGNSEMLLLEQDGGNDTEAEQLKNYRRIGVSWKFRSDFFEGTELIKIRLV